MTAAVTLRFGELGVDALKELVNIGAGRALTTLAQMTGGAKVTMSVPSYQQGSALKSLVRGQPRGVLVRLSISVGTPCSFFLIFDERAAKRWAAKVMGKPRAVSALGPIEESALLEVGNIMACAFLDAIAGMTRVRLLPGPPVAEYGGVVELLTRELVATPDPVLLATRFSIEGSATSGRLLLLTNGDSAWSWVEKLGVAPGA